MAKIPLGGRTLFTSVNLNDTVNSKNFTEKSSSMSDNISIGSSNLSEKVLGRRIVNYMRNEALVGRINKQKIQVNEIFQFQ